MALIVNFILMKKRHLKAQEDLIEKMANLHAQE